MRAPRLSLTSWIGLSLALGVFTGLFFGEACASLKVIGDIFIRLLQMTVLPYIFMSMIASIGGLSLAEAKLLGKRIIFVLLGLWAVALALVFILPLALPEMASASFFSVSMLEAPAAPDMVSLFVPRNPFESLSTSVVPAVVLFCIAVGLALIAVPGKERLVEPMHLAAKSLARVATFMVRLTPIGIFAIAAAAAGTMTLEDLSRIQAYLLMHTACALLLTFGVIPLSLAILTPFSYRELLAALKDPLVAGFTTGNVFITLPMLTESIRGLYADRGLDSEKSVQTVEVVLPIAYSFPNLGKLLALLFIPFAAWYSGQPMELMEYPGFLASSLATFFGSTSVAIPFLLDRQHLPADMFQLFMLTGIVAMRFGAIAAIVHHFCLGLLVSGQEQGVVRLRFRKLVPLLGITVGVVVLIVVGLRLYLATALEGAYDKDNVVAEMQLLRSDYAGLPREVELGSAEQPGQEQQPKEGESRLALIQRRGSIRVGFVEDSLPWAYRNAQGQLVGLDIELAYRLATELGVELVFVAFEREMIREHLRDGVFDVAMTGWGVTTTAAAAMEFTKPYMQATLGIACLDYDRKRWQSSQAIREIDAARIGIVGNNPFYTRQIRRRYPQFEMLPLPSLRAFFEGRVPEIEAVVMSAEAASAWSLLFPNYAVVVPKPHIIGIPVAYPVAAGDGRFLRFLDHWIDFKVADGTIREVKDHWIYGKLARTTKPRWCIARDVLGWMD